MGDFSGLGKAQKTNSNLEKAQEFKKLLSENPTLQDLLFAWTPYIELVNACGYGETGGLNQTKPAEKIPNAYGKLVAKKGTRQVEPTSQIVGYVLKNTSTDITMDYETEEYTLEDDSLISKKVVKKLLPGETCMLTRKYTTKFCARPEISFKLANATVSRTSAEASVKTKEEILERAYLRLKEKGVSVHDADFKINIAKKAGELMVNNKLVNTYKVKPEYFETFGYLDYAEVKTNRNRRATIDNMNRALAAQYIYNITERNE